jgi:hypothetical protein
VAAQLSSAPALDAGHFMAEAAPGQITDLLRQLLKR